MIGWSWTAVEETKGKNEAGTYHDGRQRSQLHIRAALEQGLAAAPEVDDAIVTLVHAHLEAGDDEDRVLHVGDECSAIHNAADDDASADVDHGEGGGRVDETREVDHAAVDLFDEHGGGGANRGRWWDYVDLGFV